MKTITIFSHRCVNCGEEVWLGAFFEGNFLCQCCYPNVGDIVFQLRAENAELLSALKELEHAENRYRADHDVMGDGSIEAGRSWDHMRHSGDRARTLLAKCQDRP